MPVVETEFLAHYTSFEVLRCLVDSKKMWATDIMYLNDELEYRYAANLIREEVQDDCPSIKHRVNEILRHLVNETNIAGDRSVYVISFSKEQDLLSQWRAYSPSEGGLSIAFSKLNLEIVACMAGLRLVKCVYCETEQRDMVRGGS